MELEVVTLEPCELQLEKPEREDLVGDGGVIMPTN